MPYMTQKEIEFNMNVLNEIYQYIIREKQVAIRMYDETHDEYWRVRGNTIAELAQHVLDFKKENKHRKS